MKAGLLAASAVAFVQVAVAQPHGIGHRHLHERDVASTTTTVVVPEVIVYVDQNGNTVSEQTMGTPSPTSSSTSSEASTTSSSSSSSVSPVQAYASSSSSYSPPPSSTSAPAYSAPSSSSAPAPSSPSYSGGGGGGGGGGSLSTCKGATYSPYNDDGSCKDQGSVSSDVSTLAAQGFNAIRIYGVDCAQVANVVPVAKQHGMQIIAGLFNIGQVNSDLGSMKSQLNGDFSGISAVTVYNEAINSGEASASDVASAVGEAKSFLQSTNFAGGVAAVDTFNALLNPANNAVIQASDFVAANCHSFFDTSIFPGGAASYVQTACQDALKLVAGGKPVVITESGWPSDNPAGGMGANTASPSSQSQAISGIRGLSGVFAFSYFSTAWHKSPGTVENYWGFGGGS